jgi:hypothetical protein
LTAAKPSAGVELDYRRVVHARMDTLETELKRLQGDASLSQSIADVDSIIEQILRARDHIAAGKNVL